MRILFGVSLHCNGPVKSDNISKVTHVKTMIFNWFIFLNIIGHLSLSKNNRYLICHTSAYRPGTSLPSPRVKPVSESGATRT